MELERGTRLGQYELLVRVGRGGMASVWVARGRPRPDQPEQLVAIKAMLPELNGFTEFRQMFLDEGQIVRSIDHPNVVKVYEVAEQVYKESDGTEQSFLYMVMEWIEGDSLHTLISEANKRRPVPPEVAVRMVADTASGLHAAHELRGWDGELREVVHCDVSPHNILIGLDGKVKLVDFGVAGAMSHVTDDDEAKIRGKFGYMSPEQAQAKPLDRRSDVFSLGVVLFELTTGFRLFRGRDDRHTLDLVTFGKIPRPTQVVKNYPQKLERVVMRALERDLSQRFQTADELRDALETYLVEERILVPSAGVKGLLRRVLGTRIDQRRQQVRTAIRTLDGESQTAAWVSDESVTSDDDVISVSVSGTDAPSSRSQAEWSRSGLGAARMPQDHSSAGHSVSQPSPPGADRRPSSAGFIVGASIGVVLAVAAVVFVGGRSAEPTVIEMAPPRKERPAGQASPVETMRQGADEAPLDDSPAHFSIDSLPQELDDPLPDPLPASPHAPSPPNPSNEQIAQDIAALRAEPNEPSRITLRESAVDSVAQSVRLDDGTQTKSPSGPSSGGGIDRNAAAAALARTANLTGMCRRPGGQTGKGKAMVTILPSGKVQSVRVSAPFAGTPVGDCVANQFRNATVPGFSGDSVTLSKSFTIPD
jgi:eukaryotic-like serine/threonine-protein kinase